MLLHYRVVLPKLVLDLSTIIISYTLECAIDTCQNLNKDKTLCIEYACNCANVCVCVCTGKNKQILNISLLDLGDFILLTFYKSLTIRLKISM